MTRDGILIGYARTSTMDQQAGLEAQVCDLKAAGCKKLYQEQVSSVAERTQLDAALDYAREGDTLVVTKLDRLAPSARHLIVTGHGVVHRRGHAKRAVLGTCGVDRLHECYGRGCDQDSA